VLAEAGVKKLPKRRRVVLVGNKISPGNPVTKPDGTVVRTLWGELAWQLGGKKAFARVRPTTRRPPAPATCCASCSTSTGRA
jgi:predicted AAA+ superfamily ATPase